MLVRYGLKFFVKNGLFLLVLISIVLLLMEGLGCEVIWML